MITIVIAAASFLTTPLAALNTDPHLGLATSANFAAMIIPSAPHGDAVEGGNGDLAVAAVRRLQSDKVKRPVRASTTTVGTGE